MSDPKTFDALSAIVFVVGLYEGLIPFIAKLFDADPALSVPSRMDAPAWWIVAGLVLLVAIVLLERIDRAKRRAVRA